MPRYLLFTIALMLFSAPTFAQVGHNAIFFTEEGEHFWIILNGVRQNDAPLTNIKLTDLPASSYKLKVLFEDKALGEIDKTIYFDEGAREVTYRIKKNRKGDYVVRFFNDRPINMPQVYAIQYSPANDYPVYPESYSVSTTTTSTVHPSDNINVNIGAGGVNVNVSMPGATVTHSTTTTTTVPSVPVADHYILEGYTGPVGCPWPMEPQDFRAAKQTIASKDFEDSKLQISQQIINSNCLFADQVRDIMKLFTYEESKLDFAKYAYTRTFDQGNYFKVYNAFEYELSIDELNSYIDNL